jgi:hypothetical protein
MTARAREGEQKGRDELRAVAGPFLRWSAQEADSRAEADSADRALWQTSISERTSTRLALPKETQEAEKPRRAHQLSLSGSTALLRTSL